MSRKGSKAHKQRMSVAPVKLVPKPYEMMPDKEFVLKKKAGGNYYFYVSPMTGNAVEIGETTLVHEGKKLWVVKNLAQFVVQMDSRQPKRYMIANEALFVDKETAFRNWVTPAFSDEKVSEDVLVKITKTKTYKVKVERNVYEEGRVIKKETSEINVFAKNPAEARKHAVESMSHGQKALEVKEIPYEQAKKEGEIY
jgi:hypothetical protein